MITVLALKRADWQMKMREQAGCEGWEDVGITMPWEGGGEVAGWW